MNLVVLAGRLAAPLDVRTLSSGRPAVRYLLSVRSSRPSQRIDLLPVTWTPTDDSMVDTVLEATPGQSVWVVGSLQRRFRGTDHGRRSSLEIVAHQVQPRETDTAHPPG